MIEFNMNALQKQRITAYCNQGVATLNVPFLENSVSHRILEGIRIKAFTTNDDLYLAVYDTPQSQRSSGNKTFWLLGRGKPQFVEKLVAGITYSTIMVVTEKDGEFSVEQIRSIPDIEWKAENVPEFLKYVELGKLIYG